MGLDMGPRFEWVLNEQIDSVMLTGHWLTVYIYDVGWF